MRWTLIAAAWIVGSLLFSEDMLALTFTVALIYAAVTTRRT